MASVLVDFFGPTTFFPAIKAGIAAFPPTIIFHNENDDVVKVEHSHALDGWLAGKIHKLVLYRETWDVQKNHPFESNKPADVDSRKQAADWVVAHLPPGGR